MIELIENGVWLLNGTELLRDGPGAPDAVERKTGLKIDRESAGRNTISYGILKAHNTSGDMDDLKLCFDSLTSHDITYVGIIQTARASGLEKFPMPYVLTCCHNSLCAVGGTINEDDHIFGLTAARKYGGIYVPPHLAVIHQYMRETMAGCGRMILGSDSHTRYGALGTLAIGEGGGELAKQLFNKTWDIAYPKTIAVCLEGSPRSGVGPQDVALTIIKAVFGGGFVKNAIMEFVGEGIGNLNVDYRNGIDVMTTETACLSSVWRTDDAVRDWLAAHGRVEDYAKLEPGAAAYYDGAIRVDLRKIESSIALPFHPSNVYTIKEFAANAKDVLRKVVLDCAEQTGLKVDEADLFGKTAKGRFTVDQAIIAGCAGGTYDNLCDVADIVSGKSFPDTAFSLSVYPSSQPVALQLVRNGAMARIMEAGGIVRTAFCGPCFGAGDTPSNGGFSIRHTTRNFPNREGSKPGEGQVSYVALMDARSIAATAINGGVLTAATDLDVAYEKPPYVFDGAVYEKRVFGGWKHADPDARLVLGPGIRDWPEMCTLSEDILLRIASVITDPVTTTDELIPSGETASYRSNPIRLSEFALSRRDPRYVPNAKEIQRLEKTRIESDGDFPSGELAEVWNRIRKIEGCGSADPKQTCIGSAIYAVRPGDGSAREQAASAQRVLGGLANVAREYATKRYRSNLINWGMIPFQIDTDPAGPPFDTGDWLFVPGIGSAIRDGNETVTAWVVADEPRKIVLKTGTLTPDERKILLSGSLINYYKNH